MKSKLSIFDFDNTLVRSPDRDTIIEVKGIGKLPALQLYDKWLKDNNCPPRKFNGWSGRKESLKHPIFPRPLREDMLIKETADQFLKAKKDPDTSVKIMTGRHKGLYPLVLEILIGYDLVNHKEIKSGIVELICYNSEKGLSTLEWKRELILEFARDFDAISMWEDKPEHISEFIKTGRYLADRKVVKEFNVFEVKT